MCDVYLTFAQIKCLNYSNTWLHTLYAVLCIEMQLKYTNFEIELYNGYKKIKTCEQAWG